MEILKNGSERFKNALFNCTSCGCIYTATEREYIRDKDFDKRISFVSFCPECGFMNKARCP